MKPSLATLCAVAALLLPFAPVRPCFAQAGAPGSAVTDSTAAPSSGTDELIAMSSDPKAIATARQMALDALARLDEIGELDTVLSQLGKTRQQCEEIINQTCDNPSAASPADLALTENLITALPPPVATRDFGSGGGIDISAINVVWHQSHGSIKAAVATQTTVDDQIAQAPPKFVARHAADEPWSLVDVQTTSAVRNLLTVYRPNVFSTTESRAKEIVHRCNMTASVNADWWHTHVGQRNGQWVVLFPSGVSVDGADWLITADPDSAADRGMTAEQFAYYLNDNFLSTIQFAVARSEDFVTDDKIPANQAGRDVRVTRAAALLDDATEVYNDFATYCRDNSTKYPTEASGSLVMAYESLPAGSYQQAHAQDMQKRFVTEFEHSAQLNPTAPDLVSVATECYELDPVDAINVIGGAAAAATDPAAKQQFAGWLKAHKQ